jgi:hypothetical protein
MSFTEKLDAQSLAAFNVATKKKFSEQACFFLNAFWDEFGDQAEIIYSVQWDNIKKTDMDNKGIHYIHLYEEGNELDFDMSLRFFELLAKFYSTGGAKWKADYPKSIPADMTAIVRKKELRDKVDVNFDGKMSFLEYLLYQYNASPKTLMDRSQGGDLPEEVLAAMRALEEVNKRVQAYEKEKARLEEESALSGIKGLKAKNELAQLKSSPLWEEINKALITAEAAVRIASKKYGVTATGGSGGGAVRTNGTMWWLQRELAEKKKLYGKS